MNNNDFNSWSYTLGLISGYVIRMTDIVPLFSGFIFGLCVRNLPDIIQLKQFPMKIQEIITKLTDKITSVENNK